METVASVAKTDEDRCAPGTPSPGAYLPDRYVIAMERRDAPGVVVGYVRASPVFAPRFVWTQDVWGASRTGSPNEARKTLEALEGEGTFPGFKLSVRRVSVSLSTADAVQF